jgi:predicted nucleic acid-binding protein
MKKLKMYLDTSIISFVYADDAPEKQSLTNEFFRKYLSVYDVRVSSLVLTEIENTNNIALRNKLKSVIEKYDLPVINAESEDQEKIFDLARMYLKERIIPQKKFDDAVHVAICVYYEFDILLSWNFRHLANIDKQIRVNAANKKQGYLKELYLLNPMGVIYED